jgi:hypothetical protein
MCLLPSLLENISLLNQRLIKITMRRSADTHKLDTRRGELITGVENMPV